MFRGRQRRGGGSNFGVMMLAMQLFNFGFDRIPPVTLVSILAQTAIFLGLGDLDRWFPSSYEVCMSTHLVLQQKQWSRLILSTLYHASDMHLYFNMASLLMKGVMLEKIFKSRYFAYMLAVFTVLASVTYVLLNRIMATVFGDSSYELQCAVGFSGVIFALKVVTTHYSPRGMHYVMGFIPVPSRYLYWAELGLIQIIYPKASFTGHLAGILVGLLYTKGPLKYLMDNFMPPGVHSRRPRPENFGLGPGYTTGGVPNPHADPRVYARRTDNARAGPGDQTPRADHTGYARSRIDHSGAGSDYYSYTGGLSEEEQMRRATERSLYGDPGPASPSDRLYPDLDDLRRRRADRYN